MYNVQKLTGNLTFNEYEGRIQFEYKKSGKVYGGKFSKEGTIPQEIELQGENAISDFVHKKISQAQEKWSRHEAAERAIREKHITIETKANDGTLLKGRITSATTRIIKVSLDKPFKGKSNIRFGFCSANAGHYVFTGEDKISKEGYKAAYTALGWAYQDALHKPQKELAKRLNKKFKKF